ncbi:MAG: hypothetical protein JWO46_1302, partial [Nocardioidaceae bacterium]|nr:hypothetical protein [Nocardioidaceae bacterium]
MMATYDEVESMAGAGLSIKDASELLGVPAPTLRSWERRYGLPVAARTEGGHRRYTYEALTQLRLMRDEIGAGRPAADSARRVRGLLDPTNPARPRVDALLTRSRVLDAAGIRTVLDQAHEELGLAATLDEVVMPVMRQIGSLWE